MIYEGPKGVAIFTLEVIRSFLQEPKGSWKDNSLKKMVIFPMKKVYRPMPSRINENGRLQSKFYEARHRIMATLVKVKRSFLKHLKCSWKHKSLKKKQSFQWRKLRPIFSRIIEYDKPHRTIYKSPKDIATVFVGFIRSFFPDQGGCSKHNFWKKLTVFHWKNFLGQSLLELSSVTNFK